MIIVKEGFKTELNEKNGSYFGSCGCDVDDCYDDGGCGCDD